MCLEWGFSTHLLETAPQTAYVDLKGRKQKGRIKEKERMERKNRRGSLFINGLLLHRADGRSSTHYT